MNPEILRRRIRAWLIFFIAALAASGITAVPLLPELALVRAVFDSQPWIGAAWPDLIRRIALVDGALIEVYSKYPFLAYGMDWLAFAHIVIAVAFIGPLRDPVRNVWVIEFGMITCVLVIPVALILGGVRGIPFYWRLIDCSFGVVGIIPLWLVRRDILRLERLHAPQKLGLPRWGNVSHTYGVVCISQPISGDLKTHGNKPHHTTG